MTEERIQAFIKALEQSGHKVIRLANQDILLIDGPTIRGEYKLRD